MCPSLVVHCSAAHPAEDSGADEEAAAAGATATVVLVRSDRVVVANVGDSRAVLCREGKAMDLSTEHRQGQDTISIRLLGLMWGSAVNTSSGCCLLGRGGRGEAAAVCSCCRETAGWCSKALDAALLQATQQLAFASQCTAFSALIPLPQTPYKRAKHHRQS